MKNKKDLFYLGHIVEAIDDIRDYLEGFDYGDFVKDKKTQDPVFRKFEIIGEAAKNVSAGLRRRNGNVRWRDVIDMRNK